ncbi:MAG TPA: PQQ-dependent sugar dehydrogenase [Polyangiaceae bacterium]
MNSHSGRYLLVLFACCSSLALGLACSSDDSESDDTGGTPTSSGGTSSGGASSAGGTGTTNASGGTGGGGDSTSTNGAGGSAASFSCEPASGTVPSLGLDSIASGLTEPVDVTPAPGDDERLFVVEQPGTIKVVRGGSIDTFLDISDQVSRTDNERGMFSLAFHPDYRDNGLFYVHYSASEGTHDLANGTTVVSEFAVSDDPDVANPDSERVLLAVNQPNWNHNGGTIAFSPQDGFLYLGLGDGGGGGDPDENGQDQDSLLGSILRLDIDGREAGEYSIPPGNMPGGLPEIWDKGLRNPWRFSFDACNGDMYIGDVGQNEYEEINVEPAGSGSRNYGWNVREGQHCYEANSCDSEGMTEPVLDYGRGDGQSVTGGYVYRGSAIPALRGTYFYGDYGSGNVWAFDYAGGSITNEREISFDRSLSGSGIGLASFGQDNTGELYIVLRDAGEVLKIVPR